MKSIEEFFSDLERRQSSPSARFTFNHHNLRSILPEAVRQAARSGWRIFPVNLLAKATARPDLLIGEATSDLSRLEELAAEYPGCDWRVAVGPSSLCILQLGGQLGRNAFAALSREQGECLTLQAERGDAAWAFFRRPTGLVLRNAAKELAPGVRMLGDGESCFIPPSAGSSYVNPWAETEAVPCWLRELAFETPDNPPGKALPVPASSPLPVPCRSRAPVEKPTPGIRVGYAVHGQAGWRGRFRISRRR
jgi:hypothetical protein